MRRFLSTTGLVIGLALFVVVNVVGGLTLRSARLDLTSQGLYTLSDGTRNILSKLDEPLTLRFYYSKSLVGDFPQLQDYGRRVSELLEEYEAESGGKLTLEVIEPEPFSEEEDRAVSFGLQGPAINASGDRLYFGLVGTNTVDDEEVIPFFDERREEFLEYDLTQLVDNLSNLSAKKVVGLMSSLPLRGGAFNPMNPQAPRPQPWVMMSQIEAAGFEIRDLPPAETTEIDPDEIDVLMLVHPKELSDATRYAIDQYALAGGKVLAFVDPFSERDTPPPGGNPMMADRGSKLPDLFAAWGVELVEGKLAGDRKNANRIPYGAGSIDFPLFPTLGADEMDSEDVVTSQLASVITIMPGRLKPAPGATTTMTPLISTSAESMEIDVFQVQFQPDPEQILETFVPSGEPMTIAARVSGPIRTAFPGGDPTPKDEGATEDAEEDPFADMLGDSEDESDDTAGDGDVLAAETDQGDGAGGLTEGQLNAIVVADADMLHDNAWVRVQAFLGSQLLQPVSDNADFVINALDNLCGSEDLISLRSRGRSQRPFEVKEELERLADERFRAEESALEAKLQETEQKLNELQFTEDSSGRVILSAEQEAELQQFREEQVETRKKLRDVRHQLQKDIDSLGSRMKFYNIALVPALLVVSAFLFGGSRSRRQ